MRAARLIGLLLVVALLCTACTRDEDEASETTVTPAAGSSTTSTSLPDTAEATGVTDATTPAPVGTTGSGETIITTTVTTTAVSGMPGYEVVHRLIEDGNETLVIAVQPGSYSNVELENLVYDIVERFSPSTAIVVDDPAYADLVIMDERTDEQQASLDAHTFLRIEKGVEVTFYGPYADFPGMTVGS